MMKLARRSLRMRRIRRMMLERKIEASPHPR
jgi:hypothetical protein